VAAVKHMNAEYGGLMECKCELKYPCKCKVIKKKVVVVFYHESVNQFQLNIIPAKTWPKSDHESINLIHSNNALYLVPFHMQCTNQR